MTDWNTTVPEDGITPWKCAAAGNDIIMPGNPQDYQDIRQALKEDLLSKEDIRSCAGRIIDWRRFFLMQSMRCTHVIGPLAFSASVMPSAAFI